MDSGADFTALRVVHADPQLLVFDKPAGLLSVPGRGADKQDCVSARAQQKWPEALIVHRLDMATSGLLLMARGPAMQREIARAFEQRRVRKKYVAVVAGHPARDHGEIDLPLMTDWPRRPRQMVSPEGRPSLTRWQVLERGSDPAGRPCTRLALEPVTGRSHQLRVHLCAMGHPILGDALYGAGPGQDTAPRLLLHASELGLTDPITHHELDWSSPPPF